MNLRTPAVRLGLLPASIAIALTPAIAGAQEAAASSTTTLDRIEITGSRIRSADVETQQPILTLDRQALERQGYTSVADVLQNLTSAGSPAISRADALASGENVGGYYVDLRNLGAERTLVLLNGKRLGATTSGPAGRRWSRPGACRSTAPGYARHRGCAGRCSNRRRFRRTQARRRARSPASRPRSGSAARRRP
ncbi:Plug domain-containing protein, partial [uncultured Xanthomonas sp.]|uniref:Plug domain-containing protein n=1 Tax=uncultured Xanthomonas sp. TaxID=152831 RepID=UPI0025E2A93B